MDQGSFRDSKLLHFADDLPSQDKYHAAVDAAASMSTTELVEEHSCLCDALRLEDEASESGCGDYKARLRILGLLEIVQERLDIDELHDTLVRTGNRLVNGTGMQALLTKWKSQLLDLLGRAKTSDEISQAVDLINDTVQELESLGRDCQALTDQLHQWMDERKDDLPPKPTEAEFFGSVIKMREARAHELADHRD